MKNLIMLLVYSMSVYAQVNTKTNFVNFVDSLINVIPNTEFSNEYKTPPAVKLNTWTNIIQYINDGDYSSAEDSANSLDYNLYKLIDSSVAPNKDYYALVKKSSGTNYWGIFILNPSPIRQKLFIQSPHPKYDTFTGKQSALIFRQLGCKALFITGTHRCNNDTLTTCAGTTSVCGGVSTKYRISDQAHTVNGTMQKTTVVMNNNITDMIVIQPHGFAQDPGDPDLIMSNGTQLVPSPDYLSTLKTNLFAIDDTLTFKIAHVDIDWTTLTGTTNAQGRLINGSPNPCGQSASSTTGRFLHIEQAYALRNSDAERQKLANALSQTFPEDTFPVELSSFSFFIEGEKIILQWQTATEVNNYGFEVERIIKNSKFKIQNWETIGFVQGAGNSNSSKSYSFTDNLLNLNLNLSLNYRLKQIDADGSFEYSKEIEVSIDKPTVFALAQNYPNPFNPTTTISYQIPADNFVTLKIFDVLGREAATLINANQTADSYEITFNAANLPSGVYFYKIEAGSFVSVKKLLLMK